MPSETRRGSIKSPEKPTFSAFREIVREELQSLKNDFKSLKDSLHAQIASAVKDAVSKAVNEEFQTLNAKIAEQNREIEHMKKLIFDSEEAKLKEKREEASYNVILSGLKEVDNETSSVLTSKVVDVLSSFHPPVSFRAERLGKPLTDRPRLES